MLHAKFQDHRTSGSGFFFLRFLTYNYGRIGHLCHVTIYENFRFPFRRSLHMKFAFDWPSSFRGEDL